MQRTTTELDGGRLAEAICGLVVGVHADHLGRGPTKARAYLGDNVILCVMEDAMTKAELTLRDAAGAALVRQGRATMQGAMEPTLRRGVEELCGRPVLEVIGGIDTGGAVATEVFLLARRGPATSHRGSD